MEKRVPHGQMVHLSGQYYDYFLMLWLTGGILITIGFGLLVPVGWKVSGAIILILGVGCAIAANVCAAIGLRWLDRAEGRR